MTDPYRTPEPVPEPERAAFEHHVTNALHAVLIMQNDGWKFVRYERIEGPLDQPAPWWATKEWRGSHVRLHFERPATRGSV